MSALASALDTLDAAARSFLTPLEGDPGRWNASRPGKWSAGQHAEHVALCLEVPLAAFREATATLRNGALGPAPGRGPLQRLFLWAVLRHRWMPRGARARPFSVPVATPDREAALARVRSAVEGYRALADSLSPGEISRLWIPNPFAVMRWHYHLPELVCVQAVHLDHHGRHIAELPR